MSPDDLLYEHEDVFTLPGQVKTYMGNMGRTWPLNEDSRFDLVGVFAQLRPCGRWPRAVNLWEMSWRKLCLATEQQYLDPRPLMEGWWLKSNVERSGGWDRFCKPGPGSRSLGELANGPPLPCVVQQIVRLRDGAKDDYLAWVNERVAPRVAQTPWRTLMWLGALHGPMAIVYHAAPAWSALAELSSALPLPDPAWRATADSTLLEAWNESAYLQRA
jgi:hypothetical protein